jgi:hypothetical protein
MGETLDEISYRYLLDTEQGGHLHSGAVHDALRMYIYEHELHTSKDALRLSLVHKRL